jgi:hypothetical protein
VKPESAYLLNPLCFTAILCLIFDKKCHLLCVSFHNTFPLFFCSNTILVCRSGTRGEILTIKSGYYICRFVIFDNIYFYLKSSRNKIWRIIPLPDEPMNYDSQNAMIQIASPVCSHPIIDKENSLLQLDGIQLMYDQ